jgi:hypothetical protein
MTGRDSIRGIEHSWASREALESCPRCSHRAVLLPTHGRRGGERLCVDCIAVRRRAPRLFDDDTEVRR